MIKSYWTCIKYNIILFFKTICQVSKTFNLWNFSIYFFTLSSKLYYYLNFMPFIEFGRTQFIDWFELNDILNTLSFMLIWKVESLEFGYNLLINLFDSLFFMLLAIKFLAILIIHSFQLFHNYHKYFYFLISKLKIWKIINFINI